MAALLSGASNYAVASHRGPDEQTATNGPRLVVSPPVTSAPYPVEGAVFFPPRALSSLAEVRLRDSAGRSVPVQVGRVADWPDASVNGIKSLRVTFVAERTKDYRIDFGHGVSSAPVGRPLVVTEDDKAILIDTGALRVVISKRRFTLLDSVALRDRRGAVTPVLAAGEIRVIDHLANEYLATRTSPQEYTLEIQERGPLVARIRMEGGHYDASGRKCFNSIVWLWAYAGQSHLKLFHTLVHEDADPANLALTPDMARLIAPQSSTKTYGRPELDQEKVVSALQGWTIDLPWASGAAPGTWVGGVDEGRRAGELGEGVVLQQTGDLWSEAASLNGAQVGNRIPGWLQVASGGAVVSAAIRYFPQTYPKAFAADRRALHLELCSPRSGKPEFLNVVSGVARSHEIFLDFRAPEDADEAEATARYFLTGPRPKMDSSWVRTSKVLFMFAEADERTAVLDAAFSREWARSSYDSPQPKPGSDWGGAFGVRGIKDYGDYFDTNKRGARGRWNNHYSLPRELLFHWLRTGEHFSLASAEAGAWHHMDVDVQHSPGPNKAGHPVPGARWTHYSSDHQGRESGNHWWMGGLPEYYLLTGHPRAREVLEENAAYLLAAEGVKYGHKPRTSDPVARRALVDRVANLRAGSDAYRTWSMSSVACTLLYEALGDERLIDSATNGVTFLVELWKGPWPMLVSGQEYPALFQPPRGLWAQIVMSPGREKNTRGISTREQYHRLYELVLRYERWNQYLSRLPETTLADMVSQNLEWYYRWFWRPGPRFLASPRDPGTVYYWDAAARQVEVRPDPAKEKPNEFVAAFFVEMGHRLGRPEWVAAGSATMESQLTRLKPYAGLDRYGPVTVRNEYLAACQDARDAAGGKNPCPVPHDRASRPARQSKPDR